MKISRLLYPAMLALAVIGCAAPAPAATNPNAKSMIWRSVRAHRQLGPCLMNVTYVVQNVNEDKHVQQAVIRWNDPTHYVLRMTSGSDRGVLFVNGAEQVAVDTVKRLWIRLDPNDGEAQVVRQKLREILPRNVSDELANLAQQPMVSRGLSHVPLSGTVVNGVPSYRLYLEIGPTSSGSASFVAVAFGRSDALVRKFMYRNAMDEVVRFTADYKRQSHRFPASQMRFRVPSGFTEASSVREVIEIDEQ